MDLHADALPRLPGLERYCYRVASVVGLLAAGIFGYRESAHARLRRERSGTAFQLTNIIRDVGEDARKNRIYLPMDELKRFGVPAADILQRARPTEFSRLMAFQAARAREHYDDRDARPAAARGPQGRSVPGSIMAAIYRTLLDEIERDGFARARRTAPRSPRSASSGSPGETWVTA